MRPFLLRRCLPLLVLAIAVAAPWLTRDSRVRELASNTLVLSAAVAAISLLIGVPLAFLVVRTNIWGRRIAGCLIGLLLFVPLYIQAAAWQAGFGLRGWFTLATGAPPPVDGWPGTIWIHAAAAIPWVVLIVGSQLWLIEPELEEDAHLNAGPLAVFRRVTCRLGLGSLGVAALWVAVTTAAEITVTDLFQIRTLAEEVYVEAALGDEPAILSPSNLSVLLLTSAIVLAGLVVAVQLAPAHGYPTPRRALRFQLGRWRASLSWLTWAAVALLVAVPLGSLVFKAGATIERTDHGWSHGWSALKAARMTLSSPVSFSQAFGWSFVIAAAAATAAVLLALPLAWFARRGGARAIPACLFVATGLAVPGPLLGLALIAFFTQGSAPLLNQLYDHSIAAPWAAQTVRALPLAILILWHALSTVPDELLDSAATEGANRLARFWRVALPIRRAAIAVAWLTALAIALGDVAATILVVPPGLDILAIQIFGLIHYGVDDQVAGICLSLIACFALLGSAVLTLLWTDRP